MNKMKECDVCIIGSGAGGAVMAYALGKAGFSVVLLEAGRRFSPADYHTNKKTWETTSNPFVTSQERTRSYFYRYSEPENMDLSYNHLRSKSIAHGFYNKSKKRRAPYIDRVKGVGGTTLRYQGEAHRFSPKSFRYRSAYGFAEDWPIAYEDLEPYYEKAEHILGVAGSNNNPFKAPRGHFPLPHHPLSCASRRVKTGFDRLGLHLLPNSLNILPKPRDGRPACNYCNGCYLGCKMRAKGSMDVTFIKMAEAMPNVEVRPESVVREITLNKKSDVNGVIYLDTGRGENRLRAGLVVLSAGALESPRLLLNSRSPLFPDGMSNSSGMVGKNFMETLTCLTTALFEEQIHSYKGVQIDSRAWDYNEPKKTNPFQGGAVFGVTALDLLGPLSYAQLLASGWGGKHKDFMRKYFGHAVNVFAIGEHLPNEKNMITIDPQAVDYYRIPVAKITSSLYDNDLRIIDYMVKQCRQIAEAAGAVEILREYSSYDLSVISHISGTCRMGNDPKKSVLSPFCQSHDIKNLFVVDSSCFVTEGGGDSPSLTIHAIALRTADYIVNEAKRGTFKFFQSGNLRRMERE
jgi:choline dehydrogenase-like flavoprotein